MILISTHTNDQDFYYDHLIKTNIPFFISNVDPNNNYMIKCNNAIQIAETHSIPYIMKCDNDIFLLPQTLDYMIDNLDILNTGNHLTIGPVLSSGIPGVEYFAKQFLTTPQQQILEQYGDYVAGYLQFQIDQFVDKIRTT
jgi:hypothetical protein